MFVHYSGLARAQGTQKWIINPERPRRFQIPKTKPPRYTLIHV
jgi:hypothetical protein